MKGQLFRALLGVALFSALAGYAGAGALGEAGPAVGIFFGLAAAGLAAVWLGILLKRDSIRIVQAVHEGERSALEPEGLALLGAHWAALRGALAARPASAAPKPALPPLPRQAPAPPVQAAPAASGVSDADLAAIREGLLGVLDQLEGNIELLKKINALVLDLDGNIRAVAAQGAEASKFNADLLEGSERDGALVAAEIQTLMSIKEALDAGTKVIDDLASSSKEVGPVINSIFNVARKTNMLALNAAIEAARAGEQGRGFAVVAEEVRRLAEAATESTTKVERFVETLREKTSSAVQVLQGASRIEETIPVVYRISDAFINLVPAVDAANKSLGGLSQLVKENIEEIEHLGAAAVKSASSMDESAQKVRGLIEKLERA